MENRSRSNRLARQIASAAGSGVLLMGCSSYAPPGRSGGGEGTVSGTLQAVGGPAPGSPRPLRGTISLRSTSGAGRIYSATAGVDGRFSALVPVGSYVITGRSPRYQSGQANCQAGGGPVLVSAAATTEVEVFCQEQ